MSEPSPTPGLASVTEIDRVVHEPARLMLMATLYVLDSADYTFLMNLTGVTWGNLSAHIGKLEPAFARILPLPAYCLCPQRRQGRCFSVSK